MSDTPTNDPSDSPDDILRRLDALRKTPVGPAGVVWPSDVPNIPAQKVICVLSRINARQVIAQQSIAANQQELIDLLKLLLEKTSTIEALVPVSDSQSAAIEAVREQIETGRLQYAELSYRLVVAAVTLGVMILGLGAVVALFAGGQR